MPPSNAKRGDSYNPTPTSEEETRPGKRAQDAVMQGCVEASKGETDNRANCAECSSIRGTPGTDKEGLVEKGVGWGGVRKWRAGTFGKSRNLNPAYY